MEAGSETRRLRQEIEGALTRAFDPADVLPRLARLARLASPASDDGIFAHRQLAELLVERHPWRAAIYARRALAHRQADDRAWAVLAFCQTLLGNFRCAVSAYERAIACAPGNPWYAHNLGHLLDVAVGKPERALPWLRSAYAAKTENSEIVASYVHALARAGQMERAKPILELALSRFPSRELEALSRWLEQGAPARRPSSSNAPPRSIPGTPTTRPTTRPRLRQRRRVSRHAKGHPLAEVLEQGLSHLPLDTKQRERALALANDALTERASILPPASKRTRQSPVAKSDKPKEPKRDPKRDDLAGLAAAVAYAIVYVDHLPLSQAEVAAPFRVAVGRLRGRFAELRARLDLIPGDARYATTRR